MALRSDWSSKACPIARSLDALGDPWSLLVLREVLLGNCRFDGLRTTLGVADNVLAGRLTSLVEHGLLRKEPYGGGSRPRYEYRATPAGEDALPVLHALARWGEQHVPGAAMTVVCAGCGGPARSADWCPDCRAPLTVASTRWARATTPERLVDLADPAP